VEERERCTLTFERLAGDTSWSKSSLPRFWQSAGSWKSDMTSGRGRRRKRVRMGSGKGEMGVWAWRS